MDLGAEKAGFKILDAFDTDKDAIKTYNHNLTGKARLVDILQLKHSTLPKNVDLVVGGPPCQGFSTAGTKRLNDPRNQLWKTYLDVLKTVRPKGFILENVPGFLKKAFPSFCKALDVELSNSYIVESKNIYTQFYGVPQRRYRTIVIGVRRDCLSFVPWPKPETREFGNERKRHPALISILEALQDLGPANPVIDLGGEAEGVDHVFLPLEAKHYEISKHIPNGCSLKNIPEQALPAPYKGRERKGNPGWFWYYRKPFTDLPARTVLASLGPTFSQILAPDIWVERANDEWKWQPVNHEKYIDSQGLYTTPVSPRRLTVRECARLQTFPDDFYIFGNIRARYRQIGNAVPVEFSRRLALAFSMALDGNFAPVSSAQLPLEFV